MRRRRTIQGVLAAAAIAAMGGLVVAQTASTPNPPDTKVKQITPAAPVVRTITPAPGPEPKVIAPGAPNKVRTITASEMPKEKTVSPAVRQIPFSISEKDEQETVKILTVDQMKDRDRDLLADAQGTIGDRAEQLGLDFKSGSWTYGQVECAALPHHLLMRFSRNGGTGAESVFSASIPRDGNGRVRVIPIRLKGYSLFSPAPVNALTIAAFNHIREEEKPATPPDWLGTGLCYAALAGRNAASAPQTASALGAGSSQAMPARLEIEDGGDVVISIEDAGSASRPMEWSMVFDGKGKLLRATRGAAGTVSAREIRPTQTGAHSVRIPPGAGSQDSISK